MRLRETHPSFLYVTVFVTPFLSAKTYSFFRQLFFDFWSVINSTMFKINCHTTGLKTVHKTADYTRTTGNNCSNSFLDRNNDAVIYFSRAPLPVFVSVPAILLFHYKSPFFCSGSNKYIISLFNFVKLKLF